MVVLPVHAHGRCPSTVGGPGSHRVGTRRRSARDALRLDGSRSHACFTSHLPPEIPQPAPRDVLCARLSAGLRARGSGSLGSTPRSPLPGTTVPVRARPRFHLPLRGGAGIGGGPNDVDPCLTGFPFHPEPCGAGTDGAQDIEVPTSGQRKMWVVAWTRA